MKKKKSASPRSAKPTKRVAPKVAPKVARGVSRKTSASKKVAASKTVARKAPVAPKVVTRVAEPVVEAASPVIEAPVINAPPTRAPVRKIIRDGRAEAVAPAQAPSSEGMKADLQVAWDRFSEATARTSVEGRNFGDFWVGDTPAPGVLARECGELRGLQVDEITGAFDGATSRAFVESLHRAAGAAVEAPPEAEQRKALRTSVPLELTWKNDKPNYPLHVRALLGLVEWHCRLASAWPFAFARFMAKVPQRMGSDEFVALAYAVDRPAREVSELLGWNADEVNILIERAREQLVGVFESECSDVHRQWNIALRGAGVAIDHLVQRYLVDSLNREFQMLLGRMTASAMSAGLSTENGVSASGWGVGAVA